MSLTQLKIRNFRNIPTADLSLAPGANLFYGDNAQGKTAVLEAVAYLATSTSHRTRRDEELIRWGEQATFVSGRLEEPEGTEQVIEYGLSLEGKQIKVDGNPLRKVGDLYGIAQVVLFVPEDLDIINGSPSERRRFIDQTLAQVDKQHIARLQKYQQALRNRNYLLKRYQDRPVDPAEMETWDRQLIDSGVPVIEARQKALRKLHVTLTKAYHEMSGASESLALRYAGTIQPDEEQSLGAAFSERLVGGLDKDRQQGSTSAGPHRDDLHFILEGHNLRTFGSQGQRRTAALALRLAEMQYLEEETGQKPLLLVDDVIYEMDEGRRQRFLEAIDAGGQSLVTATDIEHLGGLAQRAKLFYVQSGLIEESTGADKTSSQTENLK
jgi:DNA replication and repair protein RecF